MTLSFFKVFVTNWKLLIFSDHHIQTKQLEQSELTHYFTKDIFSKEWWRKVFKLLYRTVLVLIFLAVAVLANVAYVRGRDILSGTGTFMVLILTLTLSLILTPKL